MIFNIFHCFQKISFPEPVLLLYFLPGHLLTFQKGSVYFMVFIKNKLYYTR